MAGEGNLSDVWGMVLLTPNTDVGRGVGSETARNSEGGLPGTKLFLSSDATVSGVADRLKRTSEPVDARSTGEAGKDWVSDVDGRDWMVGWSRVSIIDRILCTGDATTVGFGGCSAAICSS